VAALVSSATGIDPVLVEGARGEFTVWVGDRQVAGKDADGFPTDQAVVSAVQHALGKN
jgi:hypothetical protein